MKIRNGFVSNSSSSSFLIYGVCLEDIDEAIIGLKSPTADQDDNDYNWQDDIDEKADEAGLSYHNMCGEAGYIGLDYQSIKDDETGAEFKARATKLVNEFLKTKQPITCKTLEEAWRDG